MLIRLIFNFITVIKLQNLKRNDYITKNINTTQKIKKF